MRVMLFGANGQLGYRLAERLSHCIPLLRKDCDFLIAKESDYAALISEHKPEFIINATGFTAVDAAEQQAEDAMKLNGDAPKLLAQAARKQDIPLLHFSTDYVFDGARGAPYNEAAQTNPLNRYGASKLAGEKAVAAAGGYVFRLQWVYDIRATNFLRTMLAAMASRKELRIVADARGTPSNAADIADSVVTALPLMKSGTLSPGIYHLAAQGHTSWHGFATAIHEEMCARQMPCVTKTIEPVTSEEYPTAAQRPKDTRLNCSALAEHGITMPHWRESLKTAMSKIHAAA